jgi:hypothetical protein
VRATGIEEEDEEEEEDEQQEEDKTAEVYRLRSMSCLHIAFNSRLLLLLLLEKQERHTDGLHNVHPSLKIFRVIKPSGMR